MKLQNLVFDGFSWILIWSGALAKMKIEMELDVWAIANCKTTENNFHFGHYFHILHNFEKCATRSKRWFRRCQNFPRYCLFTKQKRLSSYFVFCTFYSLFLIDCPDGVRMNRPKIGYKKCKTQNKTTNVSVLWNGDTRGGFDTNEIIF